MITYGTYLRDWAAVHSNFFSQFVNEEVIHVATHRDSYVDNRAYFAAVTEAIDVDLWEKAHYPFSLDFTHEKICSVINEALASSVPSTPTA